MDIRKLSEEERKKYIEGFKEYVANRNGNGSNDNQTVNNIIDYSADDAVNNTFTRRNYNTDNMWNQVQNVANDNMNRFNNVSNARNMLHNNQPSSKETIWDKLNNWVFGNSSAKKKDDKKLSYNFQNNREKSKNKNQDLLQAKFNTQQSPMIFSEQEKQAIPIKEHEKQERNDSIWQDIVDVAGLVGLGSSTGAKEVLNTIESTNEKRFSNYKNLKKQQFLTSQNVSEEDKMIARNQDDLLLQKNGINTDEKIETNLVKKAIRDSIVKDEEEIANKTNRIANKGMKKLADIAPSMGQMLPGMALNTVNPILGSTYFTTSASGGYINDGLRRGMTEDEAWNYGMVMGTLEGVSDSFITGQQFNKVANAFGGKQVSKKILDSYGFNMFENAIQEAVMEPAQEITAGIVGGQNKVDWSNIDSRMLEAGFNGALMGAITNGVTYGLEKTGIVYNKIKNKEKVTANEYKEVIQENINKFGKKPVEEAMRQGATETYQELNNIIDIQQNTNKNLNNSTDQQITQEQNKTVQSIKGFHGTDANFENYNLDYFGEHDEGDFGKAIYFSTNKKTASKYGKNIKENSINLNNPLVINSEQDYQNMWHKLAQEVDKSKLTNEEVTLINDKYTSQVDKDYLLYNTLTAEEKSNALQKLGYDGIIDNTYNQIAVFDSNNIENNSKIEYNNNESVGGVNEQFQQRRMLESNNGLSRFFEEKSQQKTRQYTKSEYEQWEQSIRPIEKSNITAEQKEIKNTIKRQYDKDIVFFDGTKNNNTYTAGASYTNKNRINIDTDQIKEFGLNKLVYHESLESDILHNENVRNDIVEPALQKIIEDSNFERQKQEFWSNQDEDIPNDYLIAKEILCDRFAEMKTGEKWDYDNVLSQETNMTIDYAIENFHKSLYGKDINERSLNLPLAEEYKNGDAIQNKENYGLPIEENAKTRKHYQSILESDQVGKVGKQSAERLLKSDTYTPISNVDTISKANENINRNGAEETYISFRNKINSNERVTLQDIATGERLIQIFSQNGDMEKVNGLIQDVAILGTELGQQVQAMSLIKKASPEGQLMYLNKIVERTNAKQNADLKVTDEMSQKILNAKNQTELDDVMTDIAVELGEQLPISMKDKVRSWRYLSMLGNPKTHIKNLGANVFMNITQQVKNKVGGAIEDVAGITNKNLERTKTLKPANKEQRNFSKQDAEYMKDKIDGGGKYDIKNAIQSNQKQFNNKVLNAIANFNSDMLELEDTIFLKKAYQQALQNYMSANKLTRSDMQDSSTLQKAREYASYQAQEATFHQFNSLAQRLTEVENKGGIAGKALEAVLPFKKTPMNIAKEGIEYSPIGLAKSLTYDIAQIGKKTKDYKAKLENGTITEADYKTGVSNLITKTIDSTAKGLTGTSLAILGYALADMGMLKSGNDGEDDEFKEQLGEQEYAIRIGDNTYTLDWISPSAIPMFIGSTVHDLIHSEKEDNSNILNSLMTASAKTFEPMTDMSMLQGLTSAISSYEQGSSNMIFDLGASAVSSYLGQFVPTALGQVAKTMDDKERDTSSTEKGLAKKVDQFKKQQMAKIPVVSKMLPVRKDVWGNEKVRDSNVLVRAYDVAISPYNRKQIVEDYTDKELLSVFENTGKNILPGLPNKDLTINKEKYRLTSEEYNKAKRTFGQNSKKILDSLVKSNDYKRLNEEQKAKAIENVYSYTKEQIKANYAKSKRKKIETSTLYNTLTDLKENGGNQSDYLSYTSKIEGIEKQKEKNQILSSSDYSQITKSIIYRNTTGKEDELYNSVLGKMNINMNEYLKYKLQELESDKKDDGTTKGKSVSGSKKKKVYNYVNNMKITRDQKLILLGSQYKLDNSERTELANLINKLPNQTKDEKMKLYEKMKGFTVYKNGKVSW